MPGRRLRAAVLVVVGVLMGSEAMAQHIQMLFPNLPIRRQRPSCMHENPFITRNRLEYYGYHPTCWRRFPPGWGCPSLEAPYIGPVMEELRERADRYTREGAPFDQPLDDRMPPDLDDDFMLPPPPEDRPLFDFDAPPPPRPGMPDRDLPPPPDEDDLFEPRARAPRPLPPRVEPAAPSTAERRDPHPFAPNPLDDLPPLVINEATPDALRPEAFGTPPGLPPGATIEPLPGSVFDAPVEGVDSSAFAPPVHHAPRRPLLGSLFDGLGRRRR